MNGENQSKAGVSPLRVVGIVIVVVALVFVAIKARSNWRAISDKPIALEVWGIVLISALLYGMISILLAAAWSRIVALMSKSEQSALESHIIYARSQIAKYIPGNVFHLATRHAMGKRAGATHGSLVGAALFEAFGLLAAASSVALLGIFADGERFTVGSPFMYFALLAASLCLPLFIYFLIARLGIGERMGLRRLELGELFSRLLPAFVLYLVFFTAAGCLLVAVSANFAGPMRLAEYGIFVTVFSVAWVAGYVTPGASAGIGVREAVIVGWLGAMIGDSSALMVAVLFRIVTTLGDFFFFGAASVVNLQIRREGKKRGL